MGKTDKRRPCLIDQWLYDLRWDLAHGRINEKEYIQKIKEHEDERNR